MLFMHNRVLEGIRILLERYDENAVVHNEDSTGEPMNEGNGPDEVKELLYEALEYIQKGEQTPALNVLEKAMRATGEAFGADIQAVNEDITAIEFDSAEEKLKTVIGKME